MAETALNLLEAAAGLDVSTLADWERWGSALEILFPGDGYWIVRHARRHGLAPAQLIRLTPACETLPYPIMWFDNRGRAAAVSPFGVHYTAGGNA